MGINLYHSVQYVLVVGPFLVHTHTHTYAHTYARTHARTHTHTQSVVCICVYSSRPPKFYTENDGRVYMHPKSVNYDVVDFSSKHVIYYIKVKSSKVS